MKKKLLWITETAVMLALLVALQAVTKPMGQFVTGSCVNAVLAVTVLLAGLGSGLTVAIISPVLAFLLGIADNPLIVPAIMVGNTVFVLLLHFIAGKRKLVFSIVGWLTAAVAKFVTLYSLMAWVICGLLADVLAVKQPMADKLIPMFSWPQLVTALIGGGIAMLIVPILRKALKR